MMTKSDTRKEQQGDLFKPLLRDIVSPYHAMVKLADAIDWQSFEDGLSASFCADNGRPFCPVRLMVALHYLKYASGMSDRTALPDRKKNSIDTAIKDFTKDSCFVSEYANHIVNYSGAGSITGILHQVKLSRFLGQAQLWSPA